MVMGQKSPSWRSRLCGGRQGGWRAYFDLTSMASIDQRSATPASGQCRLLGRAPTTACTGVFFRSLLSAFMDRGSASLVPGIIGVIPLGRLGSHSTGAGCDDGNRNLEGRLRILIAVGHLTGIFESSCQCELRADCHHQRL